MSTIWFVPRVAGACKRILTLTAVLAMLGWGDGATRAIVPQPPQVAVSVTTRRRCRSRARASAS